MTKPHQSFRLDGKVKRIAVRQATDGSFYSHLTDIREDFPEAARFQLDGTTLLFLEDEKGMRY
ncbi:hypothetical protein BGX23_003818 [Mortierella sp. AD031]|nr:hypothetical protein BGX23_003818 [Mortierella sp. AD031]